MQSSEARYSIENSPLLGTRRVFRGQRKSDGKPVVVKRTRQLYPSPGEVASLRHEFSVLSRVDCSHVPRPLELIESGGRICLVLEQAAGQSLDEILAAGRPELLRFTWLALCVSKAL